MKKALELNNKNPNVYYKLGKLHYRQLNFKEAINNLEKAQSLYPLNIKI